MDGEGKDQVLESLENGHGTQEELGQQEQDNLPGWSACG